MATLSTPAKPAYWIWDEKRREYYHAEKNRNTGQWEYTWANSNSTPRTPIVSFPGGRPQPQPWVPQNDPSPPLDPYGARGGALYAHPVPMGTEAITRSFAELNIARGQNSTRSPAYSQSSMAMVRPGQSSYASPTYHSLNNPPVMSERRPDRYYIYQPTQPRRPSIGQQPQDPYIETGGFAPRRTSFLQGVGGPSGEIPAHGVLFQESRPARDQDPGGYSTMKLPEAPKEGQTGHARGTKSRGSSHEAQASVNSVMLSPSRQPSNLHTNPNTDRLDRRDFQRIQHNSKKYFVVGRVFKMFFIENAGETSDYDSRGGTSFTSVALGEVAHHQFRRFVVVEEHSNQLFCYCCQITTYGEQATTKRGIEQSCHTIIYSGPTPPQKLPGETNMNKDPIKIKLIRPEMKLSPYSRINLGKVHPIQHNVKIQKVGDIEERSLVKLLHYRKIIQNASS